MLIVWTTLLSGGSAEEMTVLKDAVASTIDEGGAGYTARINDLKFKASTYTTSTDTNGGGLKECSLALTALHKF